MSTYVAMQLQSSLQGRWLRPEIEQLLKTTIDDLVKFNILNYLHNHPDASGDVSYFAHALGFHCLDKTQLALEALAAAGLLVTQTIEKTGELHYRLTAEQSIRQQLGELFSLGVSSVPHQEIVRRLAQRSLKRAKGKNKHKSVQAHVS